MSNPWFRMYSEFATDPKVQMLTEAMQRRLIMVLCLRCSNTLVTLHDSEIAFHLRISDQELAETKALFVAKKFVDKNWNVLNWDKRQFKSDSSKDRVARHRALQKTEQEKQSSGDVTLQVTDANALEQNRTDTDTEKEANASVGKPTANTPFAEIVAAYHEKLPELPAVRLETEKRKREARSFWGWVMTSKRGDGTRRAETREQGLAFVSAYFERASENDFLMGRTPRSPAHQNWKPDFEFLISEKGRIQVVEKTQ